MYTKSLNILTSLGKVDASQIIVYKQHLDSLLSLTKAIGCISRLDELLERIMYYALTVTGAERGFLFLYSQNKGSLKLEVMHGVNEKIQEGVFSFEKYRISREIINVAENTGRALIGSQKGSSIADGFSDLGLYGIKQALCVPFHVREKPLGFLYLDHTFDRVMFRIKELEIMKSFATLTSLSIDNAYLMHKLEKRRHKNISITIKSNPSVPDLIIISIKGILDSITMKQVDEKILPVIEHEASDVIIDLRNIDYANKTGIMCFMKCLILVNHKKRALKFVKPPQHFVKPPQHVYKTFELTGFSKRFDMYVNIEDALNTLR
jgi:anti-anti-sigma factor